MAGILIMLIIQCYANYTLFALCFLVLRQIQARLINRIIIVLICLNYSI